jgi:hypothetical protein
MDTMPGRSECHSIAILFDSVEFDGKRAAFHATRLGFRSPFPQGLTVSTSPAIFDTGNQSSLVLRNQPPSRTESSTPARPAGCSSFAKKP